MGVNTSLQNLSCHLLSLSQPAFYTRLEKPLSPPPGGLPSRLPHPRPWTIFDYAKDLGFPGPSFCKVLCWHFSDSFLPGDHPLFFIAFMLASSLLHLYGHGPPDILVRCEARAWPVCLHVLSQYGPGLCHCTDWTAKQFGWMQLWEEEHTPIDGLTLTNGPQRPAHWYSSMQSLHNINPSAELSISSLSSQAWAGKKILTLYTVNDA